MTTWRWYATTIHPFFERMRVLREIFESLDQKEEHREGSYQDARIELRLPHKRNVSSEYDPVDSLIEYGVENNEILAMHRLAQVVLLYSTFDSLCRGTLSIDRPRVKKEWIDNAEKRAKKKKRKNFILMVLEEAELGGMQSTVWPESRHYIELLIELRNHLVHGGLDITEKLHEKLKLAIANIPEIPGREIDQKLESLGSIGTPIHIPRPYMTTILDKIEQLAAELIVPVDKELPSL